MWKKTGGKKLNCWEMKQCGREPGGSSVELLGICPAALDKRLEGVHGGNNAGRACWMIAGTYCQGKIQGVFAQKLGTCADCDFYKRVKIKEGSDFLPSSVLLHRLDPVPR
jgi:hypothetical protein